MRLEVFSVSAIPAEMVPGRPRRDWMDAFSSRHPYRCLPLTMANSTGWELLCPDGLTLEWNGGPRTIDLKVTFDNDAPEHPFALSHFGGGVVTFHPGRLFRTAKDWGLIAQGPPNVVKDGIGPLAGLVESDWLPFTFTMNWKMTRPGTVRFEKGEPFCFLYPIPHRALAEIVPVERDLEDDPELHEEYTAWRLARDKFNKDLKNPKSEARKQRWMKTYTRGKTVTGGEAPAHDSARRMQELVLKPEDC